jgi:hypothetical protein
MRASVLFLAADTRRPGVRMMARCTAIKGASSMLATPRYAFCSPFGRGLGFAFLRHPASLLAFRRLRHNTAAPSFEREPTSAAPLR